LERGSPSRPTASSGTPLARPPMSDASSHPGPPPGADLSGRQLGDFRLLRRLGRGAMADVYLAEQSSLGRQVALKVLRSELASDETYVKRFHREAQAAASLAHANIVQIHEVGRAEAVYYIAEEYVQGVNLRQWLARNGPPDVRLALIIMRQVAAALAKAAEHGIIHRDIKPENIMLTQAAEVKVADFGLARLSRADDGVNLTQAGITLGTPLYMSPEQFEGKPLDPRSDIYSFGVTCYRMLAGVPPFAADTALGVALQHLKKQPDSLENLRPDLPPALCRAVHKMLAKDPAGRFQSARELLHELRRLCAEHLGDDWPDNLPDWETSGAALTTPTRNETTQQLQSLMTTAAQSAVRPRRGGLWLWCLAAAAAFLLGGVAAWLSIREPPLLAGAQEVSVPKQESVFRQWLLASQMGTKEAWQAVVDYYPDKPYWTSRAKQRLALICLREDRLDEALSLFNELASLDESEPELRAFGLAGRCGVLSMQGKYRESANALAELWPIREHLREPLMSRIVDYAVRKNRSELGPITARQWGNWIDQQAGKAN